MEILLGRDGEKTKPIQSQSPAFGWKSEARNPKSDTGCWMGGVPSHGYDLRYENCEGKFLLILRYMPDGSKEVLDEDGKAVRTLARGESLSISKRDYAKLTLFESPRFLFEKHPQEWCTTLSF